VTLCMLFSRTPNARHSSTRVTRRSSCQLSLFNGLISSFVRLVVTPSFIRAWCTYRALYAYTYLSACVIFSGGLVIFYRAMHYSAKRGIAIASRPSVCLSVCLSVPPSLRLSVTLVDQDHIGWKSWKLIARIISTTPSLFVARRPSIYSQGNMEKF